MRLKELLKNLLLLCGSLLLVLLLAELVLFRFVLPGPDLARLAFTDGVLRYAPEQQGIYRKRNEIRAEFRINNAGRHSGHAHYTPTPPPGVRRIAVIGDSYVQAEQVDYDRSLAEVLEARLGQGHEVYRFGMNGAPLSEYLHVLRAEVLDHAPALVVLVLVHNDFAESWQFKSGVYTSAFLKYRVLPDGGLEEVPPTPYREPWYAPIRYHSATWRSLAYRYDVRFAALRRLLLGEGGEAAGTQGAPRLEANIDVSDLDRELATNRLVTRHVLQEAKARCSASGAELLLIMDGNRGLIRPEGPEAPELLDYTQGALRLNAMVGELAAELEIPFLDLHPLFVADYRAKGQPFAFACDNHWNAYAHSLAAEALADLIRGL